MNKFIFASSNRNKLTEISKSLPGCILKSLEDIGYDDSIIESGLTFKENALIKCRIIYNKYNHPCISDDSGLEVLSLDGKPGVFSARYSGLPTNDIRNMKKLLLEMKNIKDRSARFRTIICLKYGSKELFFEGVVDGFITCDIIGENGFGYDPIFIPNGYNKTFAELSLLEKNKISHRTQAIKKLKQYLKI